MATFDVTENIFSYIQNLPNFFGELLGFACIDKEIKDIRAIPKESPV